MRVVICEALLEAGDEAWPVPYRHQISVISDRFLCAEVFTLFISTDIKIAYLFIGPSMDASLSITGVGRAAISSISGPLVM
jgi:hypothetical protein